MNKNLSEFFKIGTNIKTKRKNKHLSQKELAEKSKVGWRTIQKYENDEVNPGVKNLEQIANTLDCDIEELIYGKSKDCLLDEQKELFSRGHVHEESIDEIFKSSEDLKKIIDNIESAKNRTDFIKTYNSLINLLLSVEDNTNDTEIFKYITDGISCLESFYTLIKSEQVKNQITKKRGNK